MPLTQQPLQSPFGPNSTTDEVIRGIDLTGKTAIVTGASAGLGVETARALAGAGAHVILAVRNIAKGEEVAAAIRASTRNEQIEVAYLDLTIWASVRAFADNLLRHAAPIHILINNAGLMTAERVEIEGGIESQFGANHLGHMLLTCLLVPLLLKGAPARVVALSSAAHRKLPAYFDDASILERPYQKLEAYAIAKTAISLFAIELNRRLAGRGVTAYSVNPGPIFTGIQAAFTSDEMKAMKFHDAEGNQATWFKPVEVGAATTVWCVVSPLLDAGGGLYCEDCNVATIRAADHDEINGVREWAADAENAKKLWALSERVLGEKFAF